MATISLSTISSAVSKVISRPALTVQIPTAHLRPVFKFPQWAVVPMAPFKPFGPNGIRRPANIEPVIIPPVYFSPSCNAPYVSPSRIAPVHFSPISIKSAVSPLTPDMSDVVSAKPLDEAPIGWKPVFVYNDNESPSSEDLEDIYPPTPTSPPVYMRLDPFKTRFCADDAELYFHYYDNSDESPLSPVYSEPSTPVLRNLKGKRSVKQPKDRRVVKKSFKKQRRHYNQRNSLHA